jgi:hypothetical protein
MVLCQVKKSRLSLSGPPLNCEYYSVNQQANSPASLAGELVI